MGVIGSHVEEVFRVFPSVIVLASGRKRLRRVDFRDELAHPLFNPLRTEFGMTHHGQAHGLVKSEAHSFGLNALFPTTGQCKGSACPDFASPGAFLDLAENLHHRGTTAGPSLHVGLQGIDGMGLGVADLWIIAPWDVHPVNHVIPWTFKALLFDPFVQSVGHRLDSFMWCH